MMIWVILTLISANCVVAKWQSRFLGDWIANIPIGPLIQQYPKYAVNMPITLSYTNKYNQKFYMKATSVENEDRLVYGDRLGAIRCFEDDWYKIWIDRAQTTELHLEHDTSNRRVPFQFRAGRPLSKNLVPIFAKLSSRNDTGVVLTDHYQIQSSPLSSGSFGWNITTRYGHAVHCSEDDSGEIPTWQVELVEDFHGFNSMKLASIVNDQMKLSLFSPDMTKPLNLYVNLSIVAP